jgi:predicted SprT family Zn-dependent metalloprotease
MEKQMKQKITPGFDGEVRFLAHRGVWVGFMGGKVVTTKTSSEAVTAWFAKNSGKVVVVNPAKTVDVSVRSALIRRTAELVQQARNMFRIEMTEPVVDFYNRGATAGKAWCNGSKVAFNEVLAKENTDKFDNTVMHEVAHLVTYVMHPGASAHGREFKSIFIRLGGNGRRCHSYDVSSVKTKKTKTRVEVRCSCKTHLISKQRAAKLSGYHCRVCKSKLTLTGVVKTFV